MVDDDGWHVIHLLDYLPGANRSISSIVKSTSIVLVSVFDFVEMKDIRSTEWNDG